MKIIKRERIISIIAFVSILTGYLAVPSALAVTSFVTFDSPAPPGNSFDLLNGVFQGIDFGIAQWRWEGAYLADPNNHIFFDSSSGTSRTFRFSPAPKVLNSMRVFTSGAGTLTLTDDAGQTFSQSVSTGVMQAVTTGWTLGASVITATFTSGWNIGIDDITFSDPIVAYPPILTITAPPSGTTTTGTMLPVSYTFSGDLAGASITHAHFRLDGGSTLMDMSLDGAYQINNVSTGSHTLLGIFARADHTEVAGTATTSVFTSVADPADPTPPTITIVSPADGATVSSSITITADATDNNGLASVQFRVDDAPLGIDDQITPYSAVWDTTAVASGVHVLSARARDLAGNEIVSAPVSVTVANLSSTDPSAIGQFSAPFTMPIVAVNMVLMPNGNVLMWDGDISGADARVWNPVTGTFTSAPNPFTNLFCSGQAILQDGSPVVIGGHTAAFNGVTDINRFNPATNTWSQLADMQYLRWYPTATMLSDGRMLVVSGATTCATCNASTPEVYNPATNAWTSLTAASYTMPLYPFMFQISDGLVLYAGSDEADTITRVLNVATQTWTTIDPVVRTGGSAAMYRPDKIIKAGTPGNVDNAPISAVTSAFVIDMASSSPAWQQVGSMSSPRAYHTLTILPDGNVIATGGIRTTDETSNQGSFTAEIWNAQTENWSTMATGTAVRSYHSSGILVPDGRVLVAGSGRLSGMTNEFRGEIFSPPYLFKGARPTIIAASSTMQYGSQSFVGTPDGANIASVGLVRLGAVTHGFDQNQRYVPLSFSQTIDGLNVQMPANGNIAPPGHYMLFLVNASGVPSIASIIQITAAVDTDAPTTPSGLIATPVSSSQINLTWNASSDNQGVAGYKVFRNAVQVATSTVTSYASTGLSASTTYTYAVSAFDAAGNVSGLSASVSTTTPAAGGGVIPVTVTFDNPAPPGSSFSYLNGIFQGMNFGTNRWRWEGPYGADPTNNIFFDSPSGTSRTFTFSPGPRILTSMRVFSSSNGTLTLTDNLGQTRTQAITTGSMQTVTTNWLQPSATVTVNFTNGWNLGVDDITYRSP